ncbi:MAG: rhodanese-related sulfurtransferase [Cyanobacteria bacterium]|nr:rhodanese-related sulfurtransferase [Cyanobacteriota bacterium]
MAVTVATLYRFADLPDCDRLREPLLTLGRSRGIKGTLILAPEGINGTIAGEPSAVAALLDWLRADGRLRDLRVRESTAIAAPFQRFKVKLKREIVTFGVEAIAPHRRTGEHVPPDRWNELVQDPEVVVVDTRNQFEVAVGSFADALDPATDSFRDFPAAIAQRLDPQRHRRVALFCTGGIRCEKASAYLLDQGFEAVYQLDGGILSYLAQIPPEESLWRGECFVFDDRVSVTHGLAPGTYGLCQACGQPLSPEELRSPLYVPDRACPHCAEPAGGS